MKTNRQDKGIFLKGNFYWKELLVDITINKLYKGGRRKLKENINKNKNKGK